MTRCDGGGVRDMGRPKQGDPLYLGRLYPVIRGVIAFLVRTLTRLEVHGLELAPARGPYILVANHLHWMDSPVLITVLPHPARVFAGEVTQLVGENALKIAASGDLDGAAVQQHLTEIAYTEMLAGRANWAKDMDRIADIIFER